MAPPLDDEAALVARARAGEAAAYRALVRHFASDAVRVATAITGSVADAEDAAQSGFTKAYFALDRFRPDAPFRPWLLRIVANEAKNARRSAARRTRLVERASTRYCALAPSAEDDAVSAAVSPQLLAALSTLDERDRTIIAFRYFAEMTEAEMAEALQCPPGTVKSRLSRALDRLRRQLDGMGAAAHG